MLSVRHIVYNCNPGSYAGGIPKLVLELASAQLRKGADVEIWVPDHGRAGTTHCHEGLSIRFFERSWEFGYAKSYRLESELARLPSGSVLHAYNTYHPLNLQAGRAAKRSKHRIFYSPQGALDPVLLTGCHPSVIKKLLYLRFFEGPCLNRADGIFALTSREERGFRKLGLTAPVHIVPNGVNRVHVATREEGHAFRRRLGVGVAAFVILFIGRINPKKRIEDIIRALALLPEEACLVIAGDPARDPVHHRHLLAAAVDAGVEARVRWAGFLDEDAKAAAYAASDLFVHASVSEGMAMAVLEAMSAGLPCVVTEGCYMAEAAEAGALAQCKQGPAAIAEAIRPLVADAEARRLGARGLDYVTRVHDWSVIADRTLRIYDVAGRKAEL